MDARQM
jgi:hypothetical protein